GHSACGLARNLAQQLQSIAYGVPPGKLGLRLLQQEVFRVPEGQAGGSSRRVSVRNHDPRKRPRKGNRLRRNPCLICVKLTKGQSQFVSVTRSERIAVAEQEILVFLACLANDTRK